MKNVYEEQELVKKKAQINNILFINKQKSTIQEHLLVNK
jgi:hypothetical protein